jgi:formamidopyrimidine-DNA glycosylase
MPELPEVETTRRGIAPYITGRKITRVIVRNRKLRQMVPLKLATQLTGQRIGEIKRKGKYLLLYADTGVVIIHLGMSGSLHIVTAQTTVGKHDHVDIEFENGRCLRFHDPRRFGLLLFTRGDPLQHPLLRDIGSEPLDTGFNGDALFNKSRGRRVAIKQFIMDSHNIAGVGNIYANEALYLAGINPLRAAGKISKQRYRRLAQSIRRVLQAAIKKGGTTLRDFVSGEGRPGYFRQHLNVYERGGLPCKHCKTPIRHITQGQRSTYYCSHCQH